MPERFGQPHSQPAWFGPALPVPLLAWGLVVLLPWPGPAPPTSPGRLGLLHGAAAAIRSEWRVSVEGTARSPWDASDCPHVCVAGVGSFLLYSVHEGIRGIPLDPNDKSDALVPVSGTSLAVGIDFHAGDRGWDRTTGLEGSGSGRVAVTRPSVGSALAWNISPRQCGAREGFRSPTLWGAAQPRSLPPLG